MAEVFLARAPSQPGSQQLVAIKRILPWANEETEFTNMFIDEACISASLKHPNVARVLEFGQEKDHYFLAMEYVSGRDLRSVLTYLQRTKTRPPVALVMVVGMRLAQALDYAHRRKRPDGTPMEIIHRDVSPPNVLLTFDGGVKLIDFGIAKASSRATRTRAGRLKGKIAYMSPEQVQGKDIDQRADLFSLGVLLYELITGESLFHGKNQIDTMHQVRRADVPAPSSRNPEVSKEVEVILYKALAKDRNERFQTAAKLREEIQRYLVRSRAVFGPEHLMRWMHEHFEGALQEERRTLRQARSLSIDDYPEDGAEDDDPTPVTSVPHEAAQAEPAYSGGGEMQMDLKATMLDGAPPAMMMEEQIYAAERDLDVTPKDGVKPKMPPMPRQKVRADTTPRMPPRAARPAAPAPASGAGPALDDAVTPRDGLAPADHRGDDTPVRKMPSAPFRPRSAAAVSLSSSFDDSWTPAEGIHTGPPPPPPVDPDDAPTELAIPTFPVQADLSDTVDTGGMIPPTSQPLVEDATMVDRPLPLHPPSRRATTGTAPWRAGSWRSQGPMARVVHGWSLLHRDQTGTGPRWVDPCRCRVSPRCISPRWRISPGSRWRGSMMGRRPAISAVKIQGRLPFSLLRGRGRRAPGPRWSPRSGAASQAPRSSSSPPLSPRSWWGSSPCSPCCPARRGGAAAASKGAGRWWSLPNLPRRAPSLSTRRPRGSSRLAPPSASPT